MNVPHYASAAAKLLRHYLPNAEGGSGDRERGIATLERAILARARRRRTQWLSGALLSAASIALAVGLIRRSASIDAPRQVSIQGSPSGRGAALRTGERAQPLPERAEVASGQRIETAQEGGASLKLSTGTSIELADSTSFRVDSQGMTEHFSLERGQLSAHVAKLSQGQRFIITMPDAELEVRGTRFRVQVLDRGSNCGAGSRTRLEVSEGVVEVRAAGLTVSVVAGQRWPTDCTDSATGLLPVTSVGSSQMVPPSRVQRRDSARFSTGAAAHQGHDAAAATPAHADAAAAELPERGSALTEANDLFAEGVALRRKGDAPAALRTFLALIARFPASPLAENARVERMRILASTHDPLAQHEAELYLSRYANGFAASEARRLTVGP